MFDIINKLGDLKKKMEEVKDRLATISVSATAGDNEIKVTMNGNRKVLSIDIAEHLLLPERKAEVEELIEIALNRALAEVEKVNETEMKSAGRDILPGLPF